MLTALEAAGMIVAAMWCIGYAFARGVTCDAGFLNWPYVLGGWLSRRM